MVLFVRAVFMQKEKKNNFMKGWKILFSYLLQYKREVVLLSFLGVVSALANGTVPYLVGRFFDAILFPTNIFIGTTFEMPVWVSLLALYGTIQLIANVVDWVNDKERRRIGTFMHADYPRKAVSILLALPMSFHTQEKTGEVWDKIIRAGNAVSTIIEQVIISLVPQILSVVVGLGIAFSISFKLALILVAGLTLYVVTLIKIVPPIVKYQKKGQKAWNKAYGDAYDALANVRTIKQSTSLPYEDKKMQKLYITKAATLWYEVEKIWSGISFYQRIIIAITQISIFIFSVHFIQAGSMTIGDLIALNGYAGMVFGPFVVLGNNWQIIQNGIVAIERAEQLLTMVPEQDPSKDALVLKDVDGNVEFQNVSFSYGGGKEKVFTDLNFQVKAGEVVALVGESGGGKSTLIDLISGYYYPTKGKVLIDGHDTRGLSLESLRQRIAVVPQEVVLFNDTIMTNIKYGNFRATDALAKAAAVRAQANVFIEKFPQKYKQMVGERGVKLSVGQKQRVAIARAVLRDPKILILDEPTSALDSKTERFITDSLEELMNGRTTFIIAHRLSTVRKADKIFVIDGGRIIETGTHDDLMNIPDGHYKYMYEFHVGLQ